MIEIGQLIFRIEAVTLFMASLFLMARYSNALPMLLFAVFFSVSTFSYPSICIQNTILAANGLLLFFLSKNNCFSQSIMRDGEK